MSEKPHRAFPAVYTAIYQIMVGVGQRHGYAMGLHGSMVRDLDVIAVPWTEDAAPESVLIDDLLEQIGGFAAEIIATDPRFVPTEKPHGRRAWTLLLDAGAFIDLSVMPIRGAERADRPAGESAAPEPRPNAMHPTHAYSLGSCDWCGRDRQSDDWDKPCDAVPESVQPAWVSAPMPAGTSAPPQPAESGEA